MTLSFRVVFSILLTAIALEAQWSDRLYPIMELTDGMRARIDLRDGSVEDWREVLGEPALTPLDFAASPSYPEYDPSSFDFRIWLAWHDAGNHLFVAAEIVDDIHVGMWPDDPPGWAPADRPPNWQPAEGTVQLLVDGDRSGGTVFETEDDLIVWDTAMGQAQAYWAVVENHENSSNVFLGLVGLEYPWVHQVPYADGSGSVLDSQPVFYVVEFYVTAFDRLIRDAPEESLVSDLFAEKTIGFSMGVSDSDGDPLEVDRYHVLSGPDDSWEGGGVGCLTCGRTGSFWAQTVAPTAPPSKPSPGPASRPACPSNSQPNSRRTPAIWAISFLRSTNSCGGGVRIARLRSSTSHESASVGLKKLPGAEYASPLFVYL